MTPPDETSLPQFATFPTGALLDDSWQKRPLLVRNPWKAWHNPIDPDELAGLACEEDVESRLVIRAAGDWRVEHGPFGESRFGKLGESDWTLLVQAVDHFVPAVAALIQPFRFVPNWRIDDVMVSYATDGGGVGPHFDQYDVFLIQGLGRRRWRIGGRCDAASTLVPHDDLRLLAGFQETDEWLLEPGDILYVPAGFAHEGIAVGADCMTYSIGFRAPSRSELIAHWCDDALSHLQDDDRYADPGLSRQDNPGEIAPAAIARLHAMVTDTLGDRDAFTRWFGRYSSTPKYPDMDWGPQRPVRTREVRQRIGAGVPLRRNSASRFSFARMADGSLLLFVDGEAYDCSGACLTLAEALCAADQPVVGPDLAQSEPALSLLVQLLNRGSIAFDEDD